MNKRVYGVLGISSIMANWNADFSGFPKTTSDGTTYGSDKALKYPMKKMWDNQGKKVVYIKSMCFESGGKGDANLIPRTLKERYEYIFQAVIQKKGNDSKKILQNLFTAIDVKNFGATFAEAGANISITGAVQFGQGFNKYEGTVPQEQSILSPFRDPSAKEKNTDGEEAKNSTLGTKIVSNEAHYFYPFSINPQAYKEFVGLGVTDGYTEADYIEFKQAAITAATAYATNAKAGCENEFALFVETEADTYLPCLDEYIGFEKGEDKNAILLGAIPSMLEDMGAGILAVEVYYNPYTTDIPEKIKGARYFNILTQKEI